MPSNACAQSQPSPDRRRVSLLVGGFVDSALRRAVAEGEAPRVDVIEMESRFGWRVLDFAWLRHQERSHAGLAIVGPPVRKTLGWSWWLAINAWWATRNDDAVYCSGEDVSVPAGILRRLSRRRTPRLVTRIEQVSIGSTRWKRRTYERLFRFAYAADDRLLCRTRAQIDELARLGLATSKASFLPEPTDTEFFSPEPHAEPANVPVSVNGKPYILSAGLEMRDYPTLLEATRGLDIGVVIAAGSPWSKFGTGLSGESAPTNVTVGRFSRAELRELYWNAALVVVPVHPGPRACGMNVVLEAWATRRPVVATDTAGLRSYIEDGRTGLLVAPGDPIWLRTRIQEVLSDAARAQELAACGYVQAIRSHSIEQFVDKVYKTIEESVASVYVAAPHCLDKQTTP